MAIQSHEMTNLQGPAMALCGRRGNDPFEEVETPEDAIRAIGMETCPRWMAVAVEMHNYLTMREILQRFFQ